MNAMLWRTSPAATELEECVLDWLREMLGLPADFKGVIADCASTASLLAITAARDAMAPEIRARGMAGCGVCRSCAFIRPSRRIRPLRRAQ